MEVSLEVVEPMWTKGLQMPGDMIGTLGGRLKPESLGDHLKVLSIPQKGQATTQTPRGKGRSGGHLMRRAKSSEKTLMLGKIKGKRRRGQQKMRWLFGMTDSMDMSL